MVKAFGLSKPNLLHTQLRNNMKSKILLALSLLFMPLISSAQQAVDLGQVALSNGASEQATTAVSPLSATTATLSSPIKKSPMASSLSSLTKTPQRVPSRVSIWKVSRAIPRQRCRQPRASLSATAKASPIFLQQARYSSLAKVIRKSWNIIWMGSQRGAN